jgi:hypothetical protein
MRAMGSSNRPVREYFADSTLGWLMLFGGALLAFWPLMLLEPVRAPGWADTAAEIAWLTVLIPAVILIRHALKRADEGGPLPTKHSAATREARMRGRCARCDRELYDMLRSARGLHPDAARRALVEATPYTPGAVNHVDS